MHLPRLPMVVVLTALLAAVALADEHILDFHSDIRIQPDASLAMHEVIRVNLAVTNASTVSFETTLPLMATERLTIVVGIPNCLVTGATQSDANRLRLALQYNAPAVAGFIGLVVVTLYYWIVRKLVLRAQGPGTIVVSYEPPPGLSPAAVTYLRHMGYDDRALVGNVVDLAVKKCVSIRQDRGTYYLTRLKEHDDRLPADEQKMLRSLFGDNPELTLNGDGSLVVAKRNLTRDLKVQEGQRLFRKNKKWMVNGVLLSLATGVAMELVPGSRADAAAFLMIWLGGWSIGVIALVDIAVHNWKTKQRAVGDIVMILLFGGAEVAVLGFLGATMGILPMLTLFGLVVANAIGIHVLRAYTPQGRKLMDQIEGFRQFLLDVDSDRIQRMNPPGKTPELFEKCLPYALALGVEQAWTKQFAGVLTEAAMTADGAISAYTPDWLTLPGWDPFVAGHFASSFGSAVSGASTSASPSSGSSGSDSEGSSGGGGGGGGWSA